MTGTAVPLGVLGVSALTLEFRSGIGIGRAVRVLGREKRLCFGLGLFQFLFRWGRNLVPVVMVVVAGPATDLRSLPVN